MTLRTKSKEQSEFGVFVLGRICKAAGKKCAGTGNRNGTILTCTQLQNQGSPFFAPTRKRRAEQTRIRGALLVPRHLSDPLSTRYYLGALSFSDPQLSPHPRPGRSSGVHPADANVRPFHQSLVALPTGWAPWPADSNSYIT